MRNINTSECLLALLREAITTGIEGEIKLPETAYEREELRRLSDEHAVTSLLYGKLTDNADSTVLQSYRLLFLSRAVIDVLSENGIAAVLLKGSCLAAYYPVPELRKSGDVDVLLLDKNMLEQARDALLKAGFIMSEKMQPLNHIALRSLEGIEVELHTSVTEPFGNYADKIIEEYMEIKKDEIVWKESMGVMLPQLPDDRQAFALLLHMLNHYLGTGFGLKLLCDWTVFWNAWHEKSAVKAYENFAEKCGLLGFSNMVNAVCKYWLGLNNNDKALPSKNDAKDLLYEIVEAGEFGAEKRERMVALRGAGAAEYAAEFHRRMKHNFPRAGRIVPLFPMLWGITLARFLYNNHKVRKTSLFCILSTAGKRGRLSKKMRLFSPLGL